MQFLLLLHNLVFSLKLTTGSLFASLCAKCSKDEALKSIVYSYRHGFSGFAAMLTESQAEILAGTY